MAFYYVPTEFLLTIACALTALPLRALRFQLSSGLQPSNRTCLCWGSKNFAWVGRQMTELQPKTTVAVHGPSPATVSTTRTPSSDVTQSAVAALSFVKKY